MKFINTFYSGSSEIRRNNISDYCVCQQQVETYLAVPPINIICEDLNKIQINYSNSQLREYNEKPKMSNFNLTDMNGKCRLKFSF